MTDVALAVLRDSVARLAQIVEPLSDERLLTPAFPTDWTVADVCSHLGSQARILQRAVVDAVSGSPPDPGGARREWDLWDAKSPHDKASDGLRADLGVATYLAALGEGQRARAVIQLGGFTFDFDAVVALRLNEHVLHTWDVAVAFDPDAVLPSADAGLTVDSLDLIVRATSRPSSGGRRVAIATTDPPRWLELELGPSGVTLSAGSSASPADLVLPTESLVRLVYGRLDSSHTPASVSGDGAVLDEVRAVFPGP